MCFWGLFTTLPRCVYVPSPNCAITSRGGLGYPGGMVLGQTLGQMTPQKPDEGVDCFLRQQFGVQYVATIVST